MSTERRRYRKKARADAEEATRLRITESAVALHGSVGPARTSISAVAEHAGVTRSTVYRHFPDEAALFDACSAHWSAHNPPPDLTEALGLEDPAERTREVLEAIYGWYSRNEQMLENLLRDEALVPVVAERFRVYHEFLASLREPLLGGRGLRGDARRRAEAGIGHALAFATWRSLVREQGLSDAETAALMTALADAAG
jgi:AcrR family transcriptional regulator